MLADRDYMRGPSRPEPWRTTTKLIVANIVFFFVFNIIMEIRQNPQLQDLLYLSKDGLLKGRIWQLLTFQFLHSDLFHILFNCLTIYIFGRFVEERMPGPRFLQLYLTAGTLGGVAQVLGGLLVENFSGHVAGASAGASALIAVFSLLFWHQQFKVLLFFIIPVDVTGRIIFWVALASSLIGVVLGFSGPDDGPRVAHLAHLGGFFSAFLFFDRHGESVYMTEVLARIFKRKRTRVVAMPPSPHVAASGWRTASAPKDEEAEGDFISKEVDPILDKISSSGIQSLTERERKILEKARSKMAKR